MWSGGGRGLQVRFSHVDRGEVRGFRGSKGAGGLGTDTYLQPHLQYAQLAGVGSGSLEDWVVIWDLELTLTSLTTLELLPRAKKKREEGKASVFI